jgi:hypothetical protein
VAFRSNTLFSFDVINDMYEVGMANFIYHNEFIGTFTVQEYSKVKGTSKEMGSFTDAAAHLICGLPVK